MKGRIRDMNKDVHMYTTCTPHMYTTCTCTPTSHMHLHLTPYMHMYTSQSLDVMIKPNFSAF